jgi:4-hydroxy-tetrahydrodipicolinate reductase
MSARSLRVAVVGAKGRLGAFVCELLRAHEDYRLVGEFGREHGLGTVLRECGAQVALDATVAGVGAEHGRMMLEAGVRPVVGTSGVTRDHAAELDRLARERGLGGIVVPNFSLGMVCLQRAAEELVRHFPDAQILELHHAGKRDAPSGTALDTAQRLARAGRGAAVPIHSVRLPGLYAHQAILFGGRGETLTLRHDMLGPQAFADGILASLRFASQAVGVAFGLDAALQHLTRAAAHAP